MSFSLMIFTYIQFYHLYKFHQIYDNINTDIVIVLWYINYELEMTKNDNH